MFTPFARVHKYKQTSTLHRTPLELSAVVNLIQGITLCVSHLAGVVSWKGIYQDYMYVNDLGCLIWFCDSRRW